MKQRGMLALFISFVVTLGNAAAASARSLRSLDAEAVAAPPSGQAFLDISESSAEERSLLLGRLSKAEGLAGTERHALQAQQRVLVALEREQETLESRVGAMEAVNRAALSGGIVVEKGTVSNSAAQTALVQQKVKMKQPAVYEVAAKKATKVVTVTVAPKNADSGFLVLMHDSEKRFWDANNKAFWEKMIGITCYLIQIFVVAFLYMQFCKHSAAPKLPESQVRTEEFQFGAFDASDLLRDCQMCLCALCCPWIRWADTASNPTIQFLAFLPGLFITALLSSAGTVTFGFSIPILLLVVVLCRQRIRDAYGLPSGSCGILAGDCLLWICCPCCAIVQESRQVEYVEVPMQEYAPMPMQP